MPNYSNIFSTKKDKAYQYVTVWLLLYMRKDGLHQNKSILRVFESHWLEVMHRYMMSGKFRLVVKS
jgi:hypothetical protein